MGFMRLSNAIEYMDTGDVEDLARTYGISPLEAIVEIEEKRETLKALQVIINNLNDKQRIILLRTAEGVTTRDIGEEIGQHSTKVSELRKGISTHLFKVADEKKINELQEKIAKYYQKKSLSENKKRLLQEAEADLDNRLAVREALKSLIDLLTPPQSTKEMSGRVSTPIYPFEWEMLVGMGVEKGYSEGHIVWKTKTACLMPEYFNKTFSDQSTVCTLCATCRRKKAMPCRLD